MQREEIAANMNRTGVIQLIGELSFALGLPHECSGCNCLTEIVEDHAGPDFLDDVPEDTIARLAKGRCTTAYAVRPGEPDLGRPPFGYGLIRVPFMANR